MNFTPEDVAKWMAGELEGSQYLYQETAVVQIGHRFGEQYTYLNENGNPAIDRSVLAAFKKLTGDSVVWDRSEFAWRKRSGSDSKGRQQEG